jgi:hypothetical protein
MARTKVKHYEIHDENTWAMSLRRRIQNRIRANRIKSNRPYPVPYLLSTMFLALIWVIGRQLIWIFSYLRSAFPKRLKSKWPKYLRVDRMTKIQQRWYFLVWPSDSIFSVSLTDPKNILQVRLTWQNCIIALFVMRSAPRCSGHLDLSRFGKALLIYTFFPRSKLYRNCTYSWRMSALNIKMLCTVFMECLISPA